MLPDERFQGKMHKIRPSIFDWAPPDPAGGDYTALPGLLAVFMGASNGFKRREGKGRREHSRQNILA